MVSYHTAEIIAISWVSATTAAPIADNEMQKISRN